MSIRVYQDRRLLPALTSLRGLAALAVVFFHIEHTFPAAKLPPYTWFRHGELGVDLFFVLSGFIIAHVYLRESAMQPLAAFSRSFLSARLARVYPLHLATLLALGSLAWLLPGFAASYRPDYFGLENLGLNLLLMQSWGLSEASWNMVSWSISAEWFAYLLFPFMALLLHKRAAEVPDRFPTTIAVAAGGILTLQYATILALGWDGYGGMALSGLVRVSMEFTLGVLVYAMRARLVPQGAGPYAWCLHLVCVVAVVSFFYRPAWWLFVPAVAVLIAVLAEAAPHHRLWVVRLLHHRTLVWLGEISFSLYMWHWLVIQILNWMRYIGSWPAEDPASMHLQAASMVTFSLAAGAVSYRWIETPARRWVRRFSAPASPDTAGRAA